MNLLVFSLLAGAFGGNLFGAVLRNLNLGLFRNTVIGAFGGYIGVSVIQTLEGIGGLVPSLAAGLVTGGALTSLVGAVMNMRSR